MYLQLSLSSLFFALLCVSLVSVYLPVLLSVSLPLYTIALLFLVFPAWRLVLNILSGLAVRKVGAEKLILTALILGTASLVLLSVCSVSIPELLATLLLYSGCVAVFMTVYVPYLSTLVRLEKRPLLASLFQFMYRTSLIVGPLLGSVLLSMQVSLRQVFLYAALLLIISATLYTASLLARGRLRRDVSRQVAEAVSYREAIRRLNLLYASYLSVIMLSSLIGLTLPIVIAKVTGKALNVGYIFAVAYAIGAITALMISRKLHKLEHVFALTGVIVLVASTVVLYRVYTVDLFMLLFAVFQVGATMYVTSITSQVLKASQDPTAVYSLLRAFENLGFLTGYSIGAVLLKLLPVSVVITIVAATTLATNIVMYIIRGKSSKEKAS